MELKTLIKKVNSLLKEIGIIDVWRELNPRVHDYTHYSHPIQRILEWIISLFLIRIYIWLNIVKWARWISLITVLFICLWV